MSDRMLQFVTVHRQSPAPRAPAIRRQDFAEIEPTFISENAARQAARCSQCGVPMCQVHCPLQNNIADWLRAAAEGRLQEAYLLSSETNTFPEICGRICPQDRLCEGRCVIAKGHGAVTIGAVERFITENAWEAGWVRPPQPADERAASVGIIGAGPAGLAAADGLRRLGYQVHVYDRYDRPGGLLVYGIPSFKLDKTVVQRRIELLRQSGVQFQVNFEVGRDASLALLRQRHDALLIATGVYKARELKVPGSTLPEVTLALDYLTASNKVGLGDKVADYTSGRLNAQGKDVVVVGGGDTAMDCVRTALRQEAKSVTCLYRRTRENMPGSPKEVKNAEEEGARFIWLATPKAYLGGRKLAHIEVNKMQLGFADEKGRFSPSIMDGESYTIPADMVIHALGFDPEDLPGMWGQPELQISKWGTLSVDPESLQTSLPGVFAAGDIVRGASLVVWAIRDGREAAEHIHGYIQSQITNATESRLESAGVTI